MSPENIDEVVSRGCMRKLYRCQSEPVSLPSLTHMLLMPIFATNAIPSHAGRMFFDQRHDNNYSITLAFVGRLAYGRTLATKRQHFGSELQVIELIQ